MVFNGRFTTNHRLYEGVQHIFYVEHEGFVSVQFFFVKWRLNLKTAGLFEEHRGLKLCMFCVETQKLNTATEKKTFPCQYESRCLRFVLCLCPRFKWDRTGCWDWDPVTCGYWEVKEEDVLVAAAIDHCSSALCQWSECWHEEAPGGAFPSVMWAGLPGLAVTEPPCCCRAHPLPAKEGSAMTPWGTNLTQRLSSQSHLDERKKLN